MLSAKMTRTKMARFNTKNLIYVIKSTDRTIHYSNIHKKHFRKNESKIIGAV